LDVWASSCKTPSCRTCVPASHISGSKPYWRGGIYRDFSAASPKNSSNFHRGMARYFPLLNHVVFSNFRRTIFCLFIIRRSGISHTERRYEGQNSGRRPSRCGRWSRF